MVSRKHLEILLAQSIETFTDPQIELEQYQTSPRVASNLVYTAYLENNIQGKKVIDLCAGTGILGIGSVILGANVTCIEIDRDAVEVLKKNCKKLEIQINTILGDVLSWNTETKFDTAILNPPFGLQSKNRDISFVKKAAELATEIYSIHDGSHSNINKLPEIFKKLNLETLGFYTDFFSIPKIHSFHNKKDSKHKIAIFHIRRV